MTITCASGADTFPWEAMAAAVDRHFATHFPEETHLGRPPVSTQVLLALEILKAELSCSDEQICSRLRTDFAVIYACGLERVHADRHQSHFVLPEMLAHFRRRLDKTLMAELLQIQSTAAREEGLVSPSHLVVDIFASEQGNQRVNDAATLYKAKKSPECGRKDRVPSASESPATRCPAGPSAAEESHAHLRSTMSRTASPIGPVDSARPNASLLDVGQSAGPLAISAALYLQEEAALESGPPQRLQAHLRQAAQHYEPRAAARKGDSYHGHSVDDRSVAADGFSPTGARCPAEHALSS
ncbi:MAG: transposase [Candidatus Latescibacterota bacterium]|nr:transposase [Candidatus Latescibacterota bacterium]